LYDLIDFGLINCVGKIGFNFGETLN